MLVTLADHSAEADTRFARAVADMPGVLRADAISGDQDALLHVAAAAPSRTSTASSSPSSAPAPPAR